MGEDHKRMKQHLDIEVLEEKYDLLSPQQRIEALYQDFSSGKILFTSSFGTSAIFLLHLFNSVKPDTPIYFIDTTYHFPETIEYKNEIIKRFDLKVIDLRPEEWKNKFTNDDETWKRDPDFCCSINKVEPLEKIKKSFDVWVSGLMHHQNEHRANLDIFVEKEDILKFHPIIDIAMEDFQDYKQRYDLPEHPLLDQGYESVGCIHCTKKGQGRQGRWDGFSKTECGLHM